MRTVVKPPASGIGHTAYVGVVAHPLTAAEAYAIASRLAGDDLLVWPHIEHGVLTVRPLEEITTAAEVRILRAFRAETDMPLRWKGPMVQRVKVCVMCGATWVLMEHELCVPCARPFQPGGGDV